MAMSLSSLTTTIYLSLCFTLITTTTTKSPTQKLSFSVELTHSQKSPSTHNTQYTSTKTLTENSNPNLPESVITSSSLSLYYIMKISIGTPPTQIQAMADTGSDLIWTQCDPCPNCFHQNAKLFKSTTSSTYKDITCPSSHCDTCSIYNLCRYQRQYQDGSNSSGNLASESISLDSVYGKEVVLKGAIFGCGHENVGYFEKDVSGIVGLGSGELSLVTQLGSLIDGKFSYCLTPVVSSGSSKMNFGSKAVVSGDGVVTTPMYLEPPFYKLTLESISVGNKSVWFTSGSTSSEGNIAIDSGTTYTFLRTDKATDLLNLISQAIDTNRTNTDENVELCYDGKSNFDVPDVRVNFRGAQVKLERQNLFVEDNGKICCTFKGSSEQMIYGNLQQMNFLIGYDVNQKTLSLKPTSCTS